MNQSNCYDLRTAEDFEKYEEERRKLQVICKCSYRCYVNPKLGYVICRHCGRKVLNKKAEFKENLMKEINKK